MNIVTVIVAAVLQMAIGMAWYSESLFGKQWRKLVGMTPKQMKEAQKTGMGPTMTVAFIASIILSFVLANFIDFTGAATMQAGLEAGFWMWLGFIATTQLGVVLWERKPVKLYYINAGYWLVAMCVIGMLLAVW